MDHSIRRVRKVGSPVISKLLNDPKRSVHLYKMYSSLPSVSESLKKPLSLLTAHIDKLYKYSINKGDPDRKKDCMYKKYSFCTASSMWLTTNQQIRKKEQ